MNANTRNKLLPAAFATSDKDEKIPEPTVVPTPSAITAPRYNLLSAALPPAHNSEPGSLRSFLFLISYYLRCFYIVNSYLSSLSQFLK